MKTAKIGKHEIEMYDSIEEMPIVRFHKYQKYLLVDAGIGASLDDFDKRIEKARRFVLTGKNDMADRELMNLRQCVFLIENELSPKHLAFAVLIKSIDGKECNDLSDDGLRGVVNILSDVPRKDATDLLGSVKKKIDEELTTYFPELFEDASVKEFYDLIRQRTLAITRAIIAGDEIPSKDEKAEELATKMITFSNPQVFYGSESAEIRYDRQFEDLCLMMAENLNVNPKTYSILEFYNAYDFLKRKAKERAENAKRGLKRR